MTKYEEARDKAAERFCDDINHGVKVKYFWYSSGADWSRDYWEKENKKLLTLLKKVEEVVELYTDRDLIDKWLDFDEYCDNVMPLDVPCTREHIYTAARSILPEIKEVLNGNK